MKLNEAGSYAFGRLLGYSAASSECCNLEVIRTCCDIFYYPSTVVNQLITIFATTVVSESSRFHDCT
jgi:hypothetical protein